MGPLISTTGPFCRFGFCAVTMTWHPPGLVHAITVLLLFLLAVFVLGLLVGLAHMF